MVVKVLRGLNKGGGGGQDVEWDGGRVRSWHRWDTLGGMYVVCVDSEIQDWV